MSSSKHIALISWDYLQPKGGLGRAMQRIVSALRSAGIDVSVGSPQSDRASDTLLYRAKKSHILFSLLLTVRLKRWITKRNIHLVLMPTGPGGVFLLRRVHVPVTAIVFHTYEQQARLVPGQWWKKMFLPLERRTLCIAKHVLCYASDTRTVLIEKYHIPAEHITLLPFPVAVPAASDINRIPGLCICVARLEQRKGVNILLRAWPQVLAHIPSARLIIVGNGVQAHIVDAAIKGIGSSVKRMASISPEEMQTLLARAEVAVCPAYLEGFGLAAVEAMAAGVAVVASDTEGLRNLVQHEHTGLLAKTGDAPAFADAIVRVLQDTQLCAQITARARDAIKSSFDPVRADSMLVQAVQALLA